MNRIKALLYVLCMALTLWLSTLGVIHLAEK